MSCYLSICDELKFQVHKGVHGFIRDEDGQPIAGARVAVANRRHDLFSATDGDYWRLLVPGSYEITVSARGFERETKSCTVLSNKATALDFSLKKMRLREPRREGEGENWSRDRIHDGESDEDGYSRYEKRNSIHDLDMDIRRRYDDDYPNQYGDMHSQSLYSEYERNARSRFPRPK